MIAKNKLRDFQKWREGNSDEFSLFDYLHGNLVTGEVAPDVIVALMALLFPAFIEEGNMVFLEEQFSQKKLHELRQERSDQDVEYWMNLLSVSSLFESVPKSFIPKMASKIKECWSQRLKEEFPEKVFVVELLEDEEELLIVFHQ